MRLSAINPNPRFFAIDLRLPLYGIKLPGKGEPKFVHVAMVFFFILDKCQLSEADSAYCFLSLREICDSLQLNYRTVKETVKYLCESGPIDQPWRGHITIDLGKIRLSSRAHDDGEECDPDSQSRALELQKCNLRAHSDHKKNDADSQSRAPKLQKCNLRAHSDQSSDANSIATENNKTDSSCKNAISAVVKMQLDESSKTDSDCKNTISKLQKCNLPSNQNPNESCKNTISKLQKCNSEVAEMQFQETSPYKTLRLNQNKPPPLPPPPLNGEPKKPVGGSGGFSFQTILKVVAGRAGDTSAPYGDAEFDDWVDFAARSALWAREAREPGAVNSPANWLATVRRRFAERIEDGEAALRDALELARSRQRIAQQASDQRARQAREEQAKSKRKLDLNLTPWEWVTRHESELVAQIERTLGDLESKSLNRQLVQIKRNFTRTHSGLEGKALLIADMRAQFVGQLRAFAQKLQSMVAK